MKQNVVIFLLIILFALIPGTVMSQHFSDTMLIDGIEPLELWGMDSTSHWWAVTNPFTGKYRLNVDGQKSDVYTDLQQLTFSPDGKRWACFAGDNGLWYLLTNDTIIRLTGTKPGELLFSPNSEVLVYSWKNQEEEIIMIGEHRLKVHNRDSKIFVSYGAERYAFTGYRGDGKVLNINGEETNVFEDIKPIGFWYDGNMIYAASNGGTWSVFKGNRQISEIYREIRETTINLSGNCAAYTADLQAGGMAAVILSDEYYEPLAGKVYSNVTDLVLHPTLPLAAYNAIWEGTHYVVLSSAEYYAAKFNGKPLFTFDGSELYFVSCDMECNVNINGRNYPLKSSLTTYNIAVKPGSRTFTYVSSSSMILRYLESTEMYAGIMVDKIISPRYNWRSGRYETLGEINNRLYMLSCR